MAGEGDVLEHYGGRGVVTVLQAVHPPLLEVDGIKDTAVPGAFFDLIPDPGGAQEAADESAGLFIASNQDALAA